MTTPNDASETKADDLQFDQAEYVAERPAGPVCAGCRSPIVGTYYAALGNLFCESCRRQIEAAKGGGSGFGRFFKALVLGSIAAVAGGLIYYGITTATGWNIGLVAVVVGVLIGGAVKRGSGNRGGRGYQLLAVFLTYTAIAGMIVPDLVAELREMGRKEEEELRQAVEAANAAPPIKVVEAKEGSSAPAQPGAEAERGRGEADLPDQVFADPVSVADEPEADDPFIVEIEKATPSLSGFLVGLVVFIGVAYALPVFAATQSPISGLIYGFAIWEAWKINRREELAFQGPYTVEAQPVDDPVAEDPSHDA